MHSKYLFSNRYNIITITLILLSCICSCLSADLGAECYNSRECNLNLETHAICLKQVVDPTKGQCDCNRGYVQDASGVSCEKVIGKRCVNDTDCEFNIRGKSGVCSSEDNTCKCPPGTILHPELSICTAKQNFINTACSSNADCDQIPLTFCSSLNKTCVCNETISFFSSKSRSCSPLPSNLLQACDFDEHCKSLSGVPLNMCRRCSEDLGSAQAWGVCKCCAGFVENQNQCKPQCSSNTGCSSGEYCELNDGFCQNLKVFNSICEATYECAGYETRNIVCVDRLSNGVRRCNCAQDFVPDRPVTDENVRCIERVENVQQCIATDVYGVQWVANPGETKALPCPGRQNGVAVWICQSNGNFQGSQPNFDNCTTQWVNEINDTLSDIIDVNTGSINIVDASELMTNMENLLDVAFLSDGDDSDDSENQFFGHEIQNMVTIVDVIVTNMVFNDSTSEDVTTIYEEATEEALKIVEKLIRFNKPWEQLPTTNRTIVFSNVLHLIEISAFQLANRVNDSIYESEEIEYAKSFHQKGFQVTSGISNSQNLVYPLNSARRKGKDSFIELPSNWQSANTRFAGNAFSGMDVDINYAKRNIPSAVFNAEEYRVETSRSLNSDLLGFSVSSEQRDIKLDDGETVKITFHHDSDSWGNTPKKVARKLHPGEKPRAAGGTVQCTRFDEATKIWTTDGCHLVETGPHSTTCACDQIAKYGVQTEYHQYPGKTTNLQATTLAGFGVSTLLQCYKVYTSKAKDLQQNVKTLMMIFLITSNLLLVGFVDRNYFYLSDTWCYIVGLLSHIVGLCALMCLATAGIHVYMFPIKVKDEDEEANENTNVKKPRWAVYKKWIYIALIAGAPIFICVITMIVGAAYGENTRVYGGDFCWLDGPYIWAFFGPVIVTVVFCAAFYVAFMIYIKKELRKNLEKSEDTMKQNLLFAILLGITWAVGFYQLGPHYSDSEVVQFTFPILVALQGVLLAAVGMEQGFKDLWQSFKEIRADKTEDGNTNGKVVSNSKSRKSSSDDLTSDDEATRSTPKRSNKNRKANSNKRNLSRDRKRIPQRKYRRRESDSSEATDYDSCKSGSFTISHQMPTTSSHRVKKSRNPETEESSSEELQESSSEESGNHIVVGTKNRLNKNSGDEVADAGILRANSSKVFLTNWKKL